MVSSATSPGFNADRLAAADPEAALRVEADLQGLDDPVFFRRRRGGPRSLRLPGTTAARFPDRPAQNSGGGDQTVIVSLQPRRSSLPRTHEGRELLDLDREPRVRRSTCSRLLGCSIRSPLRNARLPSATNSVQKPFLTPNRRADSSRASRCGRIPSHRARRGSLTPGTLQLPRRLFRGPSHDRRVPTSAGHPGQPFGRHRRRRQIHQQLAVLRRDLPDRLDVELQIVVPRRKIRDSGSGLLPNGAGVTRTMRFVVAANCVSKRFVRRGEAIDSGLPFERLDPGRTARR